MNKIKVMVVDDHPMVRMGLKQLLEVDSKIEVIAEASNGLECLQLLEKFSPDIIFMDIKMPGISGIEATRLVCQKYPQAKVIMLTIYDDDQFITEAIQVGAKGYILKKVNREELLKIIYNVMEGQAFLDPMVTRIVFDQLKNGKKVSQKMEKEQLTQRELEILKGIVEGKTDRGVAESLFISEHTVRSHIKNLYRKLGVTSKAQAVTKAMRERIINTDGRE